MKVAIDSHHGVISCYPETPNLNLLFKPFYEERVAQANSSILKDLEDKERDFISHPLFLSKEHFKIGFSSF
ncbi:hypothetical protein ASG65_01560 [Bacillus sp. Leaf13]|nr:hypothetical protein ASG65_01560 [Bacillus sp. Leaf13]